MTQTSDYSMSLVHGSGRVNMVGQIDNFCGVSPVRVLNHDVSPSVLRASTDLEGFSVERLADDSGGARDVIRR